MRVSSVLRTNVVHSLSRIWSGSSGSCRLSSSQTNKTEEIRALLSARFPQAERIAVEDVSGGCGAMFEVFVKDPEFAGLTTIKQHRIVTATLKEEIAQMHGIRIQTEAVKKN